MALPGDLTTCTVVGTYVDSAGAPLAGRITFTPSTVLADAAGSVVIPPATRVYQISGQGTFETDPLVATDNATITPQGWVYAVVLTIAGLQPQSWSILLPTSGSPVDISGITPVIPPGAVTSYASVLALAGETSRAEAAEAALLPLAGGTMAGNIAMGSHKVTGLANGSSAQDAAAFGQLPSGSSPLAIGSGGTGSTTQNFAAVFNVKGYGAGGSAYSTDDTSAIQAAITAAAAAGGSGTRGGPRVYIPAGQYKITSALTIPSYVSVEGDGMWATLIQQFTSTADGIDIIGSSGSEITGVSIRNLTVFGQAQGTGSGVGISLNWCVNAVLDNVRTALWGSHGVLQQNSWDLNCRNLLADTNGGDGLHGVTSVNNCSYIGGQFSGNTLNGISINGASGTAFTNCDVESNGQNGISLVLSFACLVHGCDFELNGQSGAGYAGLSIGGSSTLAGPSVTGCNFSGGGTHASYGISVATALGTSIHGCQFFNHVTSDIYIQSGATGTVVGPNAFEAGTSTSPATITDAGTGTVYPGTPAAVFTAADAGYAAWNFDPVFAGAGPATVPPAAGIIYTAELAVRQPKSVSQIWAVWLKPGTGAANAYFGLYGPVTATTGTVPRIDLTSDESATATGYQGFSLAGSHIIQPGRYIVAFLIGTQGGTNGGPYYHTTARTSFGAFSNTLADGDTGAHAAYLRWGSTGSGLSALPSTITVTAISATGPSSIVYPYFCALA